MADHQLALDAYVTLFETMSTNDIISLDCFYTPEARFKDPFNDVYGLDHIRHIFEHMFNTLESPTFRVDEAVLNDDIAYIKWQFNAQLKGKDVVLVGLSRVVFSEHGLVSEHIDYWDASEQFYMKLPIIGSLLRFIQRKVGI